MEKREILYTVNNANCFSHCGKQYGDSSKIKNRTTVSSRNSTSGYIFTVNENGTSEIYITSILSQQWSKQLIYGKNLSTNQQING